MKQIIGGQPLHFFFFAKVPLWEVGNSQIRATACGERCGVVSFGVTFFFFNGKKKSVFSRGNDVQQELTDPQPTGPLQCVTVAAPFQKH